MYKVIFLFSRPNAKAIQIHYTKANLTREIYRVGYVWTVFHCKWICVLLLRGQTHMSKTLTHRK